MKMRAGGWLLGCLALGGTLGAEPALSPEDRAFFTKEIQPLLKQRCYECHSHEAGKIKGGLALDSREGLLKGGDSGPAFTPGNLAKSLLITAVRYHDEDLAMPPKTQLPEKEIALLEQWIVRGAPDPREPVKGQTAPDAIWKAAATHWAFQPVRRPAVPPVANAAAVKTPIDAFLQARLEAHGLKMSPAADRLTLLRRVTYDLLGLPPTPTEAAAFLADKSPDAYEKLIDRLLASPHYGERWGRAWLDVARYADTTGDAEIQGRDNRYVFAWTYRDYVVRAFNADKPYDQFVREQLAADLLPEAAQDKSNLAALGFITVGKRFFNNVDDRIDDRIDVVTRGLLGLTVACARCHDHKFDPVGQMDYYALHGIFMSTTEPVEGPVIAPAQDPAAAADFAAKVQIARQELADFEAENWNRVLSAHWRRMGDYLLAGHELSQKRASTTALALYRQRGLSPRIGARWEAYLAAPAGNLPLFTPWRDFAALKDEEFAAKAPEVLAKLQAQSGGWPRFAPSVAKLLAGEPPKTLAELAARYSTLFTEVDAAYQEKREAAVKAAGHQTAEAAPLSAEQEPVRQLLYGEKAITPIDKLTFVAEVGMKVDRDRQKIVTRLNSLEATHPGAPIRAMVLEDKPSPQNSFVFLRGDRQKRGPMAPRAFLKVLAGPKPEPFTKGSGRLELAQAIADPQNPLTARVMVNRVWLNHFGQGLVGTPSDFGFRGDAPTHPELLDYLASTFMEGGWSLKKLHRQILLSAAYQQRSGENPAGMAKDPGNTWLWHMNPHRLDFESMRDTVLAVSGSLDSTMGGRPYELAQNTTRRTLYATVDRLNLPGLFTTFDFALPDLSSPRRYETTVPTQALFLMNSPFIIEEAKKLAERPEVKEAAQDPQRVARLYELIYQRPPAPAEIRDAVGFVKQQWAHEAAAGPVEKPAWQYGFGTYTPTTGRLSFMAMTRYVVDHWTAFDRPPGPEQPGQTLASVVLSARGGHTGPRRAAIRRWVAPAAGTYAIEASLRLRTEPAAQGVRGRILLNNGRPRQAELGAWEVRSGEQETGVAQVQAQPGDTLDFVAEPLGAVAESFSWAPVVKRADMTSPQDSERKHQWVAEADFAGPALPPLKGMTPWEKFAQVLLLTNELLYVR